MESSGSSRDRSSGADRGAEEGRSEFSQSDGSRSGRPTSPGGRSRRESNRALRAGSITCTVRLQDPLRARAVGLVPRHVEPRLVRRHQHDCLAQLLQLACPECAMPHASITTVEAGSWTKKVPNDLRDRRRLRATLPGSSDTAISKADFAMSTGTTLCFSTGFLVSSVRGDFGTSMTIRSRVGVHFIDATDGRGASDTRAQPIRGVLQGPTVGFGVTRNCGYVRP